MNVLRWLTALLPLRASVRKLYLIDSFKVCEPNYVMCARRNQYEKRLRNIVVR